MIRSSLRRSFTLLELLLVLAVIAVLAGLSAPMLRGSLRGQRLDTQTRTLIALARKARALASAEGRSYEIVIEPVEKTFRLARQRDPLAAPTDEEDPEREALDLEAEWARPFTFEDGVELIEALDTSDSAELTTLDLGEPIAIRFAPDGSAQAREIAFRSGEREQRLRVLPHVGRVALVDEAETAQ